MKKNTTLKKYLIFILLIAFSHTILSQKTTATYNINNEIEKTKVVLISKEFAIKFQKTEDNLDFEKLQNFLNEKQTLLARLNSIRDENSIDIIKQNSILQEIKELNNLIIGKKPDEIIDMRYYIFNRVSPPPKLSVKEITRQIRIFEYNSSQIEQKTNENNILNESISNVQQDIQDCQNQIKTALDVENRKEGFKSRTSIYFILLIGLIVICFFSVIYLKSDLTLSKDLLGGYGLQFITLFVLIIAIILFGILDILKGSELAAMLSGISGYILGKGIQDKKLLTESTNPNATVTNIVTTPTEPTISTDSSLTHNT